MINEISIYNVKFGDCFLIYGDDKNSEYKLLVDCGSLLIHSPKVVNVIGHLNQALTDNVEGLLTHFHEDHMNGFKLLRKGALGKIYLPNFFSKEEIEFHLSTIAITSPKTIVHKFAIEMLKLIPELITGNIIKPTGVIRFVKKNDKIIDDIEILWPAPNLSIDIKSKVEGIKARIINDTDTKNIGEKMKENQEKVMLIEATAEMYMELKNNNNKFLEIENNSITNTKSIDIITNIEKISLYHKDLPKTVVNSTIHSIKKIQNDYSIVFHKIQNEKSILFLGDVSIQSYNKIKHEIKKYYKLIKIAHHGTKPHYTKALPVCDRMVISNSKHRNWDIFSKYILKYPYSECICTNNCGCEVYSATLQNCNKIKLALDTKTLEKGAYCGFGKDDYKKLTI